MSLKVQGLRKEVPKQKKLNLSVTAYDVFTSILRRSGVTVMFGLQGDRTRMDEKSLRIQQSGIRFLPVQNERTAAFMACAYAKYSGKVGVCQAHSTMAGFRLLKELVAAKEDRESILVITDNPLQDPGSSEEQDSLFDPLLNSLEGCRHQITDQSEVRRVIGAACRRAFNSSGITHLVFPEYFQDMSIVDLPRRTISRERFRGVFSESENGANSATNPGTARAFMRTAQVFSV